MIIEHHEIKNWEKLLEHLLIDKELLAGISLKFRDLYAKLDQSKDPSDALDSLLSTFPASKKN